MILKTQLYKKLWRYFLFITIFCLPIQIKPMLSNRSLSPDVLRLRKAILQKSQERRQKTQEQIRSTFKVPKGYPRVILPTAIQLKKNSPINTQQKQLTPKEIEQKLKTITLLPHQVFIHEEGTSEGIAVNKEVAQLSETLKDMITMGDLKLIALSHPYDIIKKTFDLLNTYYPLKLANSSNAEIENKINILIKNFNIDTITQITNFIHFLNCTEPPIQQLCLSLIKNYINTDQARIIKSGVLNVLNRDIQRDLILLPYVYNYIKGLMIQYNMAHTEEYSSFGNVPLIPNENQQRIKTIAFSATGKNILVGRDKGDSSFAIFDKEKKSITFKENWPAPITHISTSKNKDDFYGVVSPNFATKIVIREENKWTSYPTLGTIPGVMTKAVFSPDDNYLLFSLLEDQHEISIIDLQTGKRTKFSPLDTIKDVSFNPDGTQFACISKDELILGNTKDLFGQGLKLTKWSFHGYINSIAFSSDGKKIIITVSDKLDGNCKTKLGIIDITNLNNISIKSVKNFNLLQSITDKYPLSFLLTKDDNLIVYDKRGLLFFVTFDEEGIINEIPIRQLPGMFQSGLDSLSALAISPDDKTIAGGGLDNFSRENYLHVWTLLKNEDEKLLNDLYYFDIEQLKLMYQFWLASYKKEKPIVQFNEEEEIFESLPIRIKKLLKVNED